jgi:exodeoxyribonuclease VII small subunit
VAKDKQKFEQAMARLEQIVQAIEQGKVGLEESIQQFEEGMALIRQCRSVLAEAEMKVQQLQAAGTDAAEPASGPMPPPAAS